MEEPMKLIAVDNKNYLWIESTLAKIATFGKIATVSINGKYRGGKSSLANELYGRSPGANFEVDNKNLAKTKGIWCRAKQHPNDPNKTLLILDVEGLHDVKKKNQSQDINLFCLAILLSQHLIYNAKSPLDENILNELHLVTRVSESLRISHNSNGLGGDQLALYFPHLSLVLRDHEFELVNEDGEPITKDEYLEDALRSTGAAQLYIRKYFTTRNLFVLPRPVASSEKLKNVNNVPRDELDPVFVRDVDTLKNHVLTDTALNSFQLDDAVITGQRFVTMVRDYTQAINSGEGIVVQSPLEQMRKSECTQAIEQGKASYASAMSSAEREFPLEDEQLRQKHDSAKSAGEEVFKKGARLDQNNTYQKKFQEEIEALFEQISCKNEEARKKQELERKLKAEAEQRKREQEAAQLAQQEAKEEQARLKAREEQADKQCKAAEARAEAERQERMQLQAQAEKERLEREKRERQEREERKEREARELKDREERERLIRENAALEERLKHERDRRKSKKVLGLF